MNLSSGREPAIEVKGLTRHYGERSALSDVGFSLDRGQTLCVFGANGAGKSTLLRILSTLLRPHEGEIRVLGHELPREAYALRGRIGLIGHEALLYRDLTARENLRFIAELYGEPKDEIDGYVDAMLQRIELAGRADEPIRNLSKGMLQRLATARAMLPQPELLLLDEPRANLDPGGALLLDPFIGPATHHSRVIVSHDIEYGLEQADIVLGLKLGRVEWLQPADRTTTHEVRGLYK